MAQTMEALVPPVGEINNNIIYYLAFTYYLKRYIMAGNWYAKQVDPVSWDTRPSTNNNTNYFEICYECTIHMVHAEKENKIK